MPLPRIDELKQLLGWEPEHGVLSVYLTIDHGDRGGGWHAALKDAIRRAVESVDGPDHELEVALRATAERLKERFPSPDRPPADRCVVGFLEIAAKDGEGRWFGSDVGTGSSACVVAAPRPHLQPLVELLDENRARGVVAISGEKARLFEWAGRTVTELADTEILTTGDWRERKAKRPVNVPRGQAVSSSGRDQHEQRMDHHRHGFAKQIAEEVRRYCEERGWAELVGFGEPKALADLGSELPNGNFVHAEHSNIIPEPIPSIAERLEAMNERLNREREMRVLDEIEGAAAAGGRGSLGLIETAQALAEGRVRHLLLAPESLPDKPDDELVEALAVAGSERSLAPAELLIERAIETDALVTPVEEEAAERLAALGGAGAVLRY